MIMITIPFFVLVCLIAFVLGWVVGDVLMFRYLTRRCANCNGLRECHPFPYCHTFKSR